MHSLSVFIGCEHSYVVAIAELTHYFVMSSLSSGVFCNEHSFNSVALSSSWRTQWQSLGACRMNCFFPSRLCNMTKLKHLNVRSGRHDCLAWVKLPRPDFEKASAPVCEQGAQLRGERTVIDLESQHQVFWGSTNGGAVTIPVHNSSLLSRSKKTTTVQMTSQCLPMHRTRPD